MHTLTSTYIITYIQQHYQPNNIHKFYIFKTVNINNFQKSKSHMFYTCTILKCQFYFLLSRILNIASRSSSSDESEEDESDDFIEDIDGFTGCFGITG